MVEIDRHRMRHDRRLVRPRRRDLVAATVIAALALLIVCAVPASAGGSWFETTEKQYEPGDSVTIVGYTGGGQLGWIEDGPFYGYLRVTRPDPNTATHWPAIYPTDVALGPLKLEKTGLGGYQTLRATLTFDLPRDLAPGAYDFAYCNDPCTTGLGDLIGGTVYVGVSPPRAESVPAITPSSTASTTTSVSATAVATPRRPEPSTKTTALAVLTLGALALGAASTVGVLLARRRIRSSVVGTVGE